MRDAARDALADQRRAALESVVTPFRNSTGETRFNAYGNPESSETSWGLGALLELLWRNIFIILALLALGIAAGTAVGLTRPTTYTSTTTLLLSGQSAFGSPTGETQTQERLDPALIESEMEIMRSRSTVERAVAAVGWQQVLQDLGIEVEDDGTALAAEKGFEQASDAYAEAIRARQLGVSMILSLEARAATPEGATRLASGLATAYLNEKSDERTQAASRSTDWLDDRLQALSEEVADKNQAVERFRVASNLLSIGGATLVERQISELQVSLAEAESEYASASARLRQLERISASGGGADSILTVLNSQVMVQLRAREAEAEQRIADLETRYGEEHPELIRARRELQQVKAQIDTEVSRNVSNLRNEVEVAEFRVNSIQERLEAAQVSFRQSNNNQVQLQQLEREADAATEQYQDYLSRARQIGDQASYSVTQARIVSAADQPEDPSTPPIWLWSAFGGSVGLAFGMVLAFTRAATDQRLKSSSDVERSLGVRSLVALAELKDSQLRKLAPSERNPEGFVVNRPLSAYTESVRLLLSGIMHADTSEGCISVAVTSALPGEGKTTSSLALARVASLMRLKVLVIDGDTRRRSLSTRVGEYNERDLTDVIADFGQLQNAIVVDPYTSAHVLPVRDTEEEVIPIAIRAANFSRFLDQFSDMYDLIIVDCPPMLAIAETRALTGACSATVIIAKWNSTPRSAVRTVIDEVRRAGGNLVGVTLNFFDQSAARGYGGDDKLYGGKAFKGYYDDRS